MSNSLQVASSDPVANAFPLGKYWNESNKIKMSDQKRGFCLICQFYNLPCEAEMIKTA